jgi:hypothetical protein
MRFTRRLDKHNRTTAAIAAVWLLVNTSFAWLPLLRSFTPFILPAQVLASAIAIATLLRTLEPNSAARADSNTDSVMSTTTATTNATRVGGRAPAQREGSTASAAVASVPRTQFTAHSRDRIRVSASDQQLSALGRQQQQPIAGSQRAASYLSAPRAARIAATQQ